MPLLRVTVLEREGNVWQIVKDVCARRLRRFVVPGDEKQARARVGRVLARAGVLVLDAYTVGSALVVAVPRCQGKRAERALWRANIPQREG
jgi:hypothetical protein